MRGFHCTIVNVVANGRNQSHFVAQTAVELVEHCGHCRLTVGAGHPDEVQVARRIAVKTRGDGADQTFGVGNAHDGEGIRNVDGLAHQNGGGTVFNGLAHKRDGRRFVCL